MFCFLPDPSNFVIVLNNNQSLTKTQQDTIGTVNALLGDLILTSDNVNEYDEQDWKRFDQLTLLSKCTTTNVTNLNGQTYRIDFTSDGNPCHAFLNLEKTSLSVKWNRDDLIVDGYGSLVLGDVGQGLSA